MAGHYRYDYLALQTRAQARIRTAPPTRLSMAAVAADLAVPYEVVLRAIGGRWRDLWKSELERRFEVALAMLGDRSFPSILAAAAAVAGRAG